jgi:hypothetical protein
MGMLASAVQVREGALAPTISDFGFHNLIELKLLA